MPITDEYWLEQWVREFEISSVADYQRAIQSPTVIKALYDAIPHHTPEKKTESETETYTVMAGRSLDLSASFSPACFSCLRTELATAVTRTAHYFNKVALSGPIVDRVQHGLQSKDKRLRASTLNELQPQVALINYINKIGARNRVTFVAKPSAYCHECCAKAAHEAGITLFEDAIQRDHIIGQLVKTSTISTVRNRSGNWVATVSGPMVPTQPWSRAVGTEWIRQYGSKRPTRASIAEDLLYSTAYSATQDLIASKLYKLPVVDMSDTEWSDTRQATNEVNQSSEIAMRVELPAIVGADLEDFLRLEQDESESFVKFQAALRAAIKESAQQHGSTPPGTVAKSVVDEYIRPEIADIEQRLKSATRSLGKKAGISLAVGATVTSIGLTTAIPLITTVGIGAAATWLTQLYKFYDDKASIESSDMYFLWKLERIKHDPGHSRTQRHSSPPEIH